MVLDLAADADRERFHTLLEHADVLLTSEAVFANGLAVGPTAVRHACDRGRHPHLVAVAITAFGLDGPFSEYVATDALLSATGGIAFKAGVPTDTPLFPPGHLVDDLVSITAAFAAAVRARTSASRPVPGSSSSCRRTRRWRCAPTGPSRT